MLDDWAKLDARARRDPRHEWADVRSAYGAPRDATADATVDAQVNRAWRPFAEKNDQATEAAVTRALTANEVDRAAPFAAGATGSDDFGGQMGTGLMNAALDGIGGADARFDGTADGRTFEPAERTGAARVAFADEWNVDVVASRDKPAAEARAGRIGDEQLAATALAARLNGYGPAGRPPAQAAAQMAGGAIPQEVAQTYDRGDGARFRTAEEIAQEARRVDVDLASAHVDFADELDPAAAWNRSEGPAADHPAPSFGFAAAETGFDRGGDAAEAARRVKARNAAIAAAGLNAVDPAGPGAAAPGDVPAGDALVPTGGAAEVTTAGAVYDAGDSAYGATRVGRLPWDGDPNAFAAPGQASGAPGPNANEANALAAGTHTHARATNARAASPHAGGRATGPDRPAADVSLRPAEDGADPAVPAARAAAQVGASNSNVPAAPSGATARRIEAAAARNHAGSPGAAGAWAARAPWASFAEELAPHTGPRSVVTTNDEASPNADVVARTFGDTAAFIQDAWQSGPAAADAGQGAGVQNAAFAPFGTPALQQRTGFGAAPEHGEDGGDGAEAKRQPDGKAPGSSSPSPATPPRHAR